MHSLMNKRVVVLSLILAVAWSAFVVVRHARAQETKLPQPESAINDFAEALTPATKKRLETVLANLKQRTEIELVVAIVKSTGSEDLYDYSLRAARDWNVGPGSPRQGLLLLIAVDKATFFTQFRDRKSTRLNSSHRCISYAVFC